MNSISRYLRRKTTTTPKPYLRDVKGKILLTGGAGYIGSHIAAELRAAGFDLLIIDNFSNSEKTVEKGLSQITGFNEKIHDIDCRDEDAISKLIHDENGVDGIIHLAAFKAVGESVANPMKYYDNNIASMLSILQVAEKHGVKQFVFSSSCTVYGSPESIEVNENTPFGEAYSPYGYSKQVGERLIHDLASTQPQPKFVSLRYFNPIGAHPSSKIGELPIGIPNNLVPLLCQAAAGIREEITVFGDDYSTADGTCVRDYVHVVDLAIAHVKALEYLAEESAPQHDMFNIGTGKGNSVKEIIDTFKRENNVDFKVRQGLRRPGDVDAIYANTEKAKEVLKWEPQFTLADALVHAWEWQRSLTD